MTLMTTTSTLQSNSNVVLHFNFFSLYPLPCTPFFLHPSLEGSRVLSFLMGKRKPCFIPQDTHQKIYLDNVDGNEVGQAITESHWFSKKRKATCFTIPFLCSLVALHMSGHLYMAADIMSRIVPNLRQWISGITILDWFTSRVIQLRVCLWNAMLCHTHGPIICSMPFLPDCLPATLLSDWCVGAGVDFPVEIKSWSNRESLINCNLGFSPFRNL